MKSHFVSLPDLPQEEQERLQELKDKLKYKIIDINVKIGEPVNYNQILASFGVYFIKTEQEIRVWTAKIRATKSGKIKRVSVNKSSKVRPGQSLMVIEYCPHEMEFNGLCTFCGEDIVEIKKDRDSLAIDIDKASHVIFGNQIGNQRKIVKLSISALEKIRKSNTLHLLSSKKLALVLDIDHTFLHATRDPQAKLVEKHHEFKDSVHSFTLPGHRYPYFIKIRPGFRDFLLDVAGAFDIHLYTMSMRKYAEEINLVTRDDVPSNKKLLHRLFPCDDRMVIIIDDRIDVWPNATQNVIQIHKYLFWPNTEEELNTNNDIQLGSTQIILERKIKTKRKAEIERGLKRFITNFFKTLGCYKIDIQSDIIYIFTHKSPDDTKLHSFSMAIKQALEIESNHHRQNNQNQQNNRNNHLYVLRNCKIKYKINSMELKRREGDKVLPCLSSVLLKIHKKYYQRQQEQQQEEDGNNDMNADIDARNILKEVKQEVFGGYVFVFSGVFPMDIKPQRTFEWKKAIEFGAKCVSTLSASNKEGVTHCIAPRMGTSKVAIALKLGLQIVHPNWLYNSTTHYMKSNPSIYRPQGWDQEKHDKMIKDTEDDHDHDNDHDNDHVNVHEDEDEDKDEHDGKIKSILIGSNRKRKKNPNEFDENGPRRKKAKTVKFKGIDDTEDEDEDNDIDPETKMMNSLSEFVNEFNQTKDKLLGENKMKDIIINNDNNNDDDDVNDDVDGDIDVVNETESVKEKEKEDFDQESDDNFDFEAIMEQDMDTPIDKPSDIKRLNIIKTKENRLDEWDDGINVSDYYPSISPSISPHIKDIKDINGNQNNNDDEEEEIANDILDENEEDDLIDQLDNELDNEYGHLST